MLSLHSRRNNFMVRTQHQRSRNAGAKRKLQQVVVEKRHTHYVVGNHGSKFFRALCMSESGLMSKLQSFLNPKDAVHTIQLENATYIHSQSHPLLLTDVTRRTSINLRTLPKLMLGPIRPTRFKMDDEPITNLKCLSCLTSVVEMDLQLARGDWRYTSDTSYSYLPSSVRTLILPYYDVEGPYSLASSLPFLTSLALGWNCKYPLTANSLPRQLRHLTFSQRYYFPQTPLENGILPDTLISLQLPTVCSKNLLSVLPESLTSLTVQVSSTNEFEMGHLVYPRQLTKMEIVWNENAPSIAEHLIRIIPFFPVTIIDLTIPMLLKDMVLPPLLERLEVYYFHEQYCSAFPSTLKRMKIVRITYLTQSIPEGVTTVEFGQEVVLPMQSNILPLSIKELILYNVFPKEGNVSFIHPQIVNVLDPSDMMELHKDLSSIVIRHSGRYCYPMLGSIKTIQTNIFPFIVDEHPKMLHHCFRTIRFSVTSPDVSIDLHKLHGLLIHLDGINIGCRLEQLKPMNGSVFEVNYPLCFDTQFQTSLIKAVQSCFSFSDHVRTTRVSPHEFDRRISWSFDNHFSIHFS